MPHRAADRNTSGKTGGSTRERQAADERAFECCDWLRERESSRVRCYIDEENAATKRGLAHLAALRQKLFEEVVDRVDLNRGTVPVRHGGFEYYSRHQEDRSYPIHCRRPLNSTAEQVILDENVLADGKPYFVLECLSVSPDHRRCIFGIDTSGTERLSLYLKDCGGDESAMTPIFGAAAGAAWANDGQTFFSVRLDERNRPFQVIRHRIADGSISESVAFEERDEAFRLQIARTESGRFIVVTSWAHDTTELRYLSADEPALPIRMLHLRQVGIEAYATHHGKHFYVLTKQDGLGEKITAVPIRQPMGSPAHIFHEAAPGVAISYVQAFAAHIVVCERRDGLSQFRIINMQDGADHIIALPETVHSLYPEDNREFETDTVRFGYDSLVTPYTVYDYDMTDRQLQVRQRSRVRGYDRKLYRSERILVSAADGVQVPLSLVYRKGLKRNGSHPALLYGYGAYGYCIEPQFSSLRLSLLDRGFVYAIAHVRGGGELGRKWHEQGKGRLKHNSFGDFIACAEHLVKHGYTSPARLAAMGESAGGLLAAAVINERPELFGAVVVDGPFVDVVDTLLDPALPFTISEWREWGNPAEPADRSYLHSYSPCENVKQHDYPPILMLCSFSDPRVPYWEGIKWARRIRAMSTGHREVLINVRFEAGHQGVSDRFAQVDEWALIHAFIVGCVVETSNPGEQGQCAG
jgi:oligopeptidase B